MKATTIYMTHDRTEAMTMASRIVILNQGEIQQIGTPEDIYNCPDNEFVATFIGSPSMNMMTITNHIDAQYINGLKIADQSAIDCTSQIQCRLGIRPEDLKLITDIEESQYPIQLSHLVIDLVELTGAYQLLHCHLENQKIIAAVDSNLNFNIGQTVSFGINPTDAHYFNISSGERLRQEVTSQ